jgi:hypothetical protein
MQTQTGTPLAPLALLVAGLLACSAARAADPLPPPVFEIRQSVPDTGTNIPRRVVSSNRLPLNRRWAELTVAEQAFFKSQYETLAPLDEPPFPADGLKPIYEYVYQVQRKVLARGDLVIFAEVDADGRAQTFSVVKSPDPTLTQAVAAVLAGTTFKPALCGGAPCSMGFPFRMSFNVSP